MEIVDDYGFAMEVYVKGELGRGFLDLYDATNHQYYEVKSRPQLLVQSTYDQLEKYDVAIIKDWRFESVALTSPTRGNNTSIEGSFVYKHWDVYYESHGNGIITYRWEVNESRYQTELTLAASIVATVGVGVMGKIYSGGKIGVTQSNFYAN